MRKMEEAAMKAYAQDISRGGDITTQELNAAVAAAAANYEDEAATATNRLAPGPSAIPTRAIDPLLPPIDILEDEERAKRAKMKRKANGQLGSEARDQSMWVEAKSDEGHTYYWNVKSGGKNAFKSCKSIKIDLFMFMFLSRPFEMIREYLGGAQRRLHDR